MKSKLCKRTKTKHISRISKKNCLKEANGPTAWSFQSYPSDRMQEVAHECTAYIMVTFANRRPVSLFRCAPLIHVLITKAYRMYTIFLNGDGTKYGASNIMDGRRNVRFKSSSADSTPRLSQIPSGSTCVHAVSTS